MRGFLAVVFVVLAPAAHAASMKIVIRADGCPDAATVARSLSQLLPDRSIVFAPPELSGGAVDLEIRDEGDRYRVRVAGIEKVVSDPERRCVDRAHASAVVVQLVLEPPTVTIAAPVAPVRSTRARPYIDLGASGIVGLAPDLSSGGTQWTGGAQLRLNVGRKWIGGTVGVSGFAPTNPSFGAFHYTLTRVPIDLGVYLGWRRRAVELGGGLGLVLAPLVIRGEELASAQSSTRLEVGVRLRPEARWWVRGWVALTVAITCDVAFRTYALDVNPIGQLGETPRVWTEVQLGVLFRLKKSEQF